MLILSEMEPRNSHEWCEVFGIDEEDILDPDGWDRTGDYEGSWQEEITVEEFRNRLGISTTLFTSAITNFFDLFEG